MAHSVQVGSIVHIGAASAVPLGEAGLVAGEGAGSVVSVEVGSAGAGSVMGVEVGLAGAGSVVGVEVGLAGVGSVVGVRTGLVAVIGVGSVVGVGEVGTSLATVSMPRSEED